MVFGRVYVVLYFELEVSSWTLYYVFQRSVYQSASSSSAKENVWSGQLSMDSRR